MLGNYGVVVEGPGRAAEGNCRDLMEMPKTRAGTNVNSGFSSEGNTQQSTPRALYPPTLSTGSDHRWLSSALGLDVTPCQFIDMRAWLTDVASSLLLWPRTKPSFSQQSCFFSPPRYSFLLCASPCPSPSLTS